MVLLSRSYGYSKIGEEDPEEIKHRKAQFLIYKTLQQADSRRKPSWIKVKTFKLKIKIGKRLKRLRKSILLGISAARGGMYSQVVSQIRTWKRLIRGREAIVSSLPPVFT